MSNYLGRKSEFTPSVYTRYFERTETRKSPNGHIYFNDHEEELSKTYQTKRDLLFKRLFPSKYADNKTEQINPNGHNHSSNNTADSLGDYISLSNENASTQKKRSSSPPVDVVLSSSDENEDDLLTEDQLPSHTHELIVGHVHPRSTIENIRAILIRELYQRTSDSHTEWLKCKMDISRDYINPKYYADFQRRYRKEKHKKKSKSNKDTTDNDDPILDLTTAIQIDQTIENDDIIETSSTIPSNNPPEFIVLDSDEDEDTKSSYFIDRSSTFRTAISQPTTLNEDYHEEDSKYAQLPTRTTSSPSIIRPILSKHQRRKKLQSTDPPKPLVSAIDRIIDQMDNSNPLDSSKTMKQQNLLIKQIKKRKKKKKKKPLVSTTTTT